MTHGHHTEGPSAGQSGRCLVASARLVGGGVVVGDDHQHQDDEDEATAAARDEALAWLRAIRAELAGMPHEPPSGR